MKITVTLSEQEVKLAIARYVERVRGGSALDASVIISASPAYDAFDRPAGYNSFTASVEIEEKP